MKNPFKLWRSAASCVASNHLGSLEKFAAALIDLPPAPFILLRAGEFDPDKGAAIGMNQAAVTSADNYKPIAGTTGLDHSAAIAVYNEATKTGGIAHLAIEGVTLQPQSRSAFEELVSAVRETPQEELSVRIMGLPFSSDISAAKLDRRGRIAAALREESIVETFALLSHTPGLRILSADIGNKPYPRDVAIDARRWNQGLIRGAPEQGVDLHAMKRPAPHKGLVYDMRAPGSICPRGSSGPDFIPG